MRCECPQCGAFMEHAETSASCVCPVCLDRCNACLGTGSALSRESIKMLKNISDPSILTETWEKRALQAEKAKDNQESNLRGE